MAHETDKHLPIFVGPEGVRLLRNRGSYVVLDFETTNHQNGLAINPENHIVLACWTVVQGEEVTKRSKFADEYDLEELLKDIRSVNFVVAHNAKFELQWLERCGLDLRTVLVYDTMVAEWVILGNRRGAYDLSGVATRYGLRSKDDLVSKLIKSKVCPSNIPKSWLLKYCNLDVDLCHEVFKRQQEKLDEQDVWNIVLARMLMVPVLASIEKEGLQLDPERVEEEYKRLHTIKEESGELLAQMGDGINFNSPKQLGEFLYDKLGFEEAKDNGGKVIKTPSGGRSGSIDALKRLVPTNKRQRDFLDAYFKFNGATTLLSKNVEFFKRVCDEYGGRFFGQLRQCRTANHRLASSGIKLKFKGLKTESAPQLQNLPRQYKRLFTSDDDAYVVTEYDGSQIEFRVAAQLGADPVAEADIVNGVDIHSFTRDTMNRAYKEHRIPKEIDRQDAKPQTFAPLYGAFGKDKAEQEYAKAFRKKYHGIHKEQQRWTLIVADEKKLTTPYGLTFHWPYATMSSSGYVKYSTEIFNLPISGFATGEIIPIALVHFWHRIKETRCRIFNTVHDSIIVYNHKDEIEQVTEIAKIAMTHDVYKFLEEVYGYTFTVPLGFGMKTSSHWGDSKEEHKWDVWPDGNERYQVDIDKKIDLIYDTRKEK